MKEAIEELKRLSQDEEIIGLYDAEQVERKTWKCGNAIYYQTWIRARKKRI